MENILVMVGVAGVVLVGLAIIVGKLSPGDGLLRISAFLICLCLAPTLACLLKAALAVSLKPILLLLAIALAVTVCVRLLLTMFS